ncbi:MAG: cell division protein ZapE [Parvularculaceae bacterium]
MTKGPLARYRNLVADGALDPDAAQEAAIVRLQRLADDLREAGGRTGFGLLRRFAGRRAPAPTGVYLWGGVGRGKTLLMDLFFNNVGLRKKRRVHFHEFMADVQDRIAEWRVADAASRRAHPGRNRRNLDDPIAPVAHDLARDARLFCFDELLVTDIADAMVLGRLFEALFDEGASLVTTSNRRPDDLYKDGLNRQLLLPTIDLLKTRLDVVELAAERDYRLAGLAAGETYFAPLGAAADKAMDAAWGKAICGATPARETLRVKGRDLVAPRAARGAARFDFAELCEAPLGAGDYLAIARRYGAVFLDRIPQMGPEKRNEAIRFVTLIDALFDTRTKFVCSADAEPDALYPAGDGAFEFARTASRLMEMRTTDYWSAERAAAPTPERVSEPA